MTKQFGGKVTKVLKERYSTSQNWKNGKFENLEKTVMDISFQDLPKLLYKQFFNAKGRTPKQDLSIEKFESNSFLKEEGGAQFIWYGHSVLLARIEGLTILIDPMLGPNASPIAPFKTARFSKNTLNLIEDLPDIDLLLLTHDHYDHLDLDSMKRLIPKVKKAIVSLGCARHLISWGMQEHIISELDWWDNIEMQGLQITCTPSRHFSGRGLTDRAKSLWCGWILKTNSENIYWSGDSGYGSHFKEIGTRLGPFDYGFMECGQYNEHWHLIHMYPEESVQAAFDAKVAKATPVHWGGFALSLHTWKDPIQRFTQEAKLKGLKFQTPKLGEQFSIQTNCSDEWWKEFE